MTETIRDVNGKEWRAGCLPRTTKVGDGTFKVFKPDDCPRASSVMISAISVSLIWHIINQSSQGSCCGCMGIGLMMLIREMMGLIRIVLSQASLYGQGNGGRDQGMAIDRCLRLATEIGACPIDVIDQYDWQGFHRRTWPPDWKIVAKQFRILEAEDCASLADMNAANELGYPVGYGSKGHAVIRIAPGLDINSWDYSWGNRGIGQWASDREIERDLPRYGAWVLRQMVDPLDDSDLPQPVD